MEPAERKRAQASPYKVFVDDNYHHMDESERYLLGRYATLEEAVAACKAIVDEFLKEHCKPGMTARELYKGYPGYGEDPWVSSETLRDGEVPFSAWGYAKQRCKELCGQTPRTSSVDDKGSPN